MTSSMGYMEYGLCLHPVQVSACRFWRRAAAPASSQSGTSNSDGFRCLLSAQSAVSNAQGTSPISRVKSRLALQTVLRDAHDAPLTSLHFFAGEPRLMSAAADNSVKQWLFDNADGTGRLLRFRSGHAAPPSCLRYYGDGTRLLSAGAPGQEQI
jgi:U3 small nucleolar RNA-associated protein 21